MISNDKPDRFTIRIGIRPPGKTRRLAIAQAEIADEAAHQHPQKRLVRCSDRIMLDDEVTIFVYTLNYAKEFSFIQRSHSTIKPYTIAVLQCMEFNRLQ